MNKYINRVLIWLTVALSGLAAASCNKPRKSAPAADMRTMSLNTATYLRGELLHPQLFGLTRDSSFIQDVYLPEIRKALDSLDDLEEGKKDIVPVAGFVRPFQSRIILYVVWLQRDDSKRTVVLQDKDGIFAKFSVPTEGKDPRTNYSFLRLDGVTLSKPKDLVLRPDDFVLMEAKRPFDLTSVHLTFLKTQGHSEHKEAEMDLPLCPLPDSESPATSRASENSGEQSER